MQSLRVVILHNQLSKEALADEADVMEQVMLVESCLKQLGHTSFVLPLSLNLEKGKEALLELKPDLVFNLVESFENKGELVYIAPALLDALKIPYTGTATVPMFQSASKTLTKENLSKAGIVVAEGLELDQLDQCKPEKTYILKPRWEEGSLGLDEDAVFKGDNMAFVSRVKGLSHKDYFVEEFIEGREFNCAIVATREGPRIVAVAEITFIDFPEEKPKMLGYKAKWDEESFEYKNTVRRLDFDEEDIDLIQLLGAIGLKCWKACGLGGYARVDFRVDQHNQPYVLEVNSNPCISPDSGYYAAVEHAGMQFTDIVKLIVEDALKH